MLPHAGLVLLAATQLGTAVAQGVVPSPTSGPTLESCEKVRERTGPPPNVYSARFASTGANILVDLDAASDQAGMLAGEYFPCAELLDFADVDTAECFWVGATQIYAEVNNALNFVPGETVTLRAQTTMLACDDDRCECRVLNDASSPRLRELFCQGQRLSSEHLDEAQRGLIATIEAGAFAGLSRLEVLKRRLHEAIALLHRSRYLLLDSLILARSFRYLCTGNLHGLPSPARRRSTTLRTLLSRARLAFAAHDATLHAASAAVGTLHVNRQSSIPLLAPTYVP